MKISSRFFINIRPTTLFKTLGVFILAISLSCQSFPNFTVEEYHQYEALFSRKSGWTGADGVYSVNLGDSKTLWLFGDTWMGEIKDGRHVDSDLINNSVAIQHGKQPVSGAVTFHYGRNTDGSPRAFVLPQEGNGWYWPYDGILTSQGLFLFLMQMVRTGDEDDVFAFKLKQTWLGHVANPEDSPQQWQLSQIPIPWSIHSPGGDTFFGSAVMADGDFLYIYGISEDVGKNYHTKHMVLARAPLNDPGDFENWRFFNSGDWATDPGQAGRLCRDMANEFSVSYQSDLGKYIVVYSENGMSRNIVVRTAPEPFGPWGDPVVLYQCPEMSWGADILCYAAKAHPELSLAPEELIVTYVANSTEFERIENDARLYRPRFLRVVFK